MSAEGVRTHSLRVIPVDIDGSWEWGCRGCGDRWEADADREGLERQPCGTPKASDA